MIRAMVPCKLIVDEFAVKERCLTKFGLQVEEVFKISLAAAAARNDRTQFMPHFSGGMLSYIYGVEQLRQSFLSLPDYEAVNPYNVDCVFSAQRNVKVIFQNADFAATERFEPKALSPIGDGKMAAVEGKPPRLFPELDQDERGRRERVNRFNSAEPWFVITAYDKDGNPSCELSTPRSIVNGNFGPFVERVFISAGGGLDPEALMRGSGNPPTDIKPIISKR